MSRSIAACLLLVAIAAAGCERVRYDPDRATTAYPEHLHRPQSVGIEVFREGTSIEIVNSTPVSYSDCNVWINQRYGCGLTALPAGRTVTMSLWGFFDQRGEGFSAGGIWRTEPATPIRLVELQVSDDDPMIGLITVPAGD